MIGYKDKPRKTKEYSLWEVMNNVKKDAIKSAVKFLSWREAILDYIDEEGFNVKTYKEIIHNLTEDIYRPIIGWSKYQSDEELFTPGSPHPRADKLKAKYSITPNMRELEINKDIYNYYRKEILGDE
jgi:predicted nucleotide-binding protein (sugar kinase/HSP70/actin superfamily)